MDAKQLRRTTSRNLRRLIEQAQYDNLHDFCQCNGFSYSSIQALFIGRAVPRLDTITELAHAFEMKPHVFVREILS